MSVFENRMSGYAAYHKHPRNKFTHFFGVPMVYYSPLIALGWVRFEIAGVDISLAWVVFAAIMLWYFTMDFTFAAIMTIISIPIVYLCDSAARLPFSESLILVLAINVVGWAIQLLGHYFEGRRPALVDNLTQSLMAPLFLIAETMFFLGMRKDLEHTVEQKVAVHKFPNS